MSKKTALRSAPKPSRPDPKAMQNYIESGRGLDVIPGGADTQKTGNTETQKSVKAEKAEPTARLTVDMPASLHRRFKAACVVAGVKMNDELRRYIEQRTAELESER